MKDRRLTFLFTIMAILAGAGLRIAYVARLASVDGDNAVFALMAKHISELKTFYIYMPLAHYSAALSAYAVAVLYKIFGVSSGVFIMVGLGASCLWVAVMYLLAREMLDNAGSIVAVSLTLIPPFMLLAYSINVIGGYSEGLVFIPLVLLLLTRWNGVPHAQGNRLLFLMGACAGAGLWTAPTFMPVLLAIGTVFVIRARRAQFSFYCFALFVAGFLIGYSPAILYNLQHPMATLFRLGGDILDLDRSVLSLPHPERIIAGKAIWRIAMIPSLLVRVPYSLLQIMGSLSLVLFAAAVYLTGKERFARFLKSDRLDGLAILTVFVAWHSIIAAASVGGKSCRYMFPVAAVAPVFIGKILSDMRSRSKICAVTLFAAIMAFNIYGIGNAFRHAHTVDYASVARWLEANGISGGYADYWTAYAVTFESGEKVKVSPTLFHPDFSDRWPQETAKIRRAGGAAFIFTRDPYILYLAEKKLRSLGVGFKKKVFEGFVVVYGFSRAVYPEELQLPCS